MKKRIFTISKARKNIKRAYKTSRTFQQDGPSPLQEKENDKFEIKYIFQR